MNESLDYEQSVPYTYGGAAGTYAIVPAYPSDCEYQVLAVAFNAQGVAGLQEVINPNISAVTLANNASDGRGFGTPGYHFESLQQQTYAPNPAWIAVGDSLQFICSSKCYITLIYRRCKRQPMFVDLIVAPDGNEELVQLEHVRRLRTQFEGKTIEPTH